MEITMPEPRVAFTMSKPGAHVLSFRVEDLPDGYGQCIECSARVDREAWLIERCPGKREENA